MRDAVLALTRRRADIDWSMMSSVSDWRDTVVSTPDVLHGKPRIKGTRVPVSLILGYLAAGRAADDIRHEFPDLTPEQIAACLSYARDLSEFEVAAARL